MKKKVVKPQIFHQQIVPVSLSLLIPIPALSGRKKLYLRLFGFKDLYMPNFLFSSIYEGTPFFYCIGKLFLTKGSVIFNQNLALVIPFSHGLF